MRRLPGMIVAIACLVASLTWPVASQAATPGLTITPAKLRIAISANESEKPLTILVGNQTETEVTLRFAARDFGGLEDTGGLFFLGAKADDHWDPHRLAKWITLTPQAATIAPGSQQAVLVTISSGPDLAPGGHYAAITATLSSQNETSMSINQSLASLLFVTKQGGGQPSLKLEKLSAPLAVWGLPDQAEIRLSNNGNTHATPRGTVLLKNPFGHTVAKGIINEASTTILPSIGHTFTPQLQATSPPWWPGMYTLAATYRYDGTDQSQQSSRRLFMLGWVGTGLVVLVVGGSVVYVAKRKFFSGARSHTKSVQ